MRSMLYSMVFNLLMFSLLFGCTPRGEPARQLEPLNRVDQTAGSALEQDVRFRLRHHKVLAARPIEVEVTDGRVVLEGDVNSALERALAGRIGSDTVGVREVENNLRVTGAGGAAPSPVIDDDALEDLVGETLLLSDRLTDFPIEVSANKGVVTLRGRVANRSLKVYAEELSSNIVGVQAVINNLTY